MSTLSSLTGKLYFYFINWGFYYFRSASYFAYNKNIIRFEDGVSLA